MSKTSVSFVILFLTVIFAVPACRTEQGEVQIRIGRLEQDMFSIPVDSIETSIPCLQRQYGELFDLYSHEIISIGDPADPRYPGELTRFLTDSYMYKTYQRVSEVYSDISDIEFGLSKAFSNYREIFPERIIPSVYTLISGFNQSIVTADTILAIALDKYLGKDEKMYGMLDIANYQRQVMDKKYVVSDCMKAWLYTEFPYNDSIDNVLNNILYEGKIIYAVRRMTPETPDSLVFGYTPGQIRWCRNNTAQMWTFLVERKMLYATDYLTINKLISPAPFCSLFTRESPGRAAIWLGYRIIGSYMEHNRVSLTDLLSDNDYQAILAKARFKP